MGATGPHFSEIELACHHCGVNGCKQSLVDVLEAFRAIVGKPVMVSSAYRCPRHNAEAGGAGRSEHVEGLAADIRVEGMSAAELETAARKIQGIRGIGRNDHQQYVHVDVRPTLTLARWCYEPDGKWCSYYPPMAEAA